MREIERKKKIEKKIIDMIYDVMKNIKRNREKNEVKVSCKKMGGRNINIQRILTAVDLMTSRPIMRCTD